MIYNDFELLATNVKEIKEAEKKRVTFQVRVIKSPAGEDLASMPTGYDAREMRQRLQVLETRTLDWEGVICLGAWLGTILFPAPVRELLLCSFARIRDPEKEGLRIRLRLEGALHNIPWEYVLLNRGGGEATQSDMLGLMPNVSIVRHQAATLPAWDIQAQLPMRMLVGLASPEGYAMLNLDKERQSIEEAVSQNTKIDPVFLPNMTSAALLKAIPQAHLFHFAGHGDFEKRMGVKPGTFEGKGFLILDDGYGDPQPIEAGTMAVQLRQAGVRVAVLGACNSGRRDDVNVWSSVATALLKAELGAVVGMQYTIGDANAIAFSKEFYSALLAGLPIDEAAARGRITVAANDPRDWGVPVLYLRSPDGVIFPEYTNNSALAAAQQELRIKFRARIKEVYGSPTFVDIGDVYAGSLDVGMDVDTWNGDGSMLKIDTVGGNPYKPSTTNEYASTQRSKAAMSTTVNASLTLGEQGNGANASAVQLNVYPYFKAAPTDLRCSFDALMKDKLQGFVGRQFVFDALDDFLHSHDSGYFILRGVPGIGKSAFMAKLINERGYIHHFNVASQNIRSTRAFLENIIAQLIACYDLPYEELPPRALDDSGFLMQCLNEAAATRQESEERIIIAIDALDEVDRLGLAAAVNTLYLPATLPKGVYIIVTTRPLDDMHLQTMQQQILDLEADSEGNLQDITTYIETYIQREGMQKRLAVWGVSKAQFVAGLRKKSQGNFMYLYYVLPAIEHGEFVHGTLDELPDGLMAYYQRHWRQMREGDKQAFDTVYEPIVCILGVAQEPVTVQQIANWTKLQQGQVKENIRRWREFLEEEPTRSERKYRIYHASFQDFLKEQVDLVRYDDMIADYYLELAGFVE